MIGNDPRTIQTYQGLMDEVKSFLESRGYKVVLHDLRKDFIRPRYELMHGFRFSQRELLIEALEKRRSGLIVAPTRWGKCLGKEEELIMFDGSSREAQYVEVGDLVMGPDSKPRRVAAVTSGQDVMYMIKPRNCASWVCTQDHILVLQCIDHGATIDYGDRIYIRLCDYLEWDTLKKRKFHQVQTALDFPSIDINPLKLGLSSNGVRIPKCCLINSRKVRLETLACLLDDGGYMCNDSHAGFDTLNQSMSDDFVFLCRSLGFMCSCTIKARKMELYRGYTTVYTVVVWGELSSIPTVSSRFSYTIPYNNEDHLTTSFEVELLGVGDYAGMELEGESQEFVMSNFTVTHNTTLIINTIRAFPKCCITVTLPGADLVRQMYADVKKAIPNREVKMLGAGSRVRFPSEHINVVSMDSLDKCDTGRTDLVIVDEPHACVTNSRLPHVTGFDKARMLGFSATPEGRFDGRDRVIIGAIGPVLAERTYKEGVAEGAICPLVVLFLKVDLDWTELPKDRHRAYKHYLFESESMANITARISSEIIPEDWQSLIFIKNEAQADLYLEYIGSEGTIAMAKRMKVNERKEMFRAMQSDEVKRCIATNIYAQGVTFNNVRAIINAEAGGDNTSAIQKPGRLAEIRPDKTCGIIFDFMFDAQGLDTNNLSDYDNSHTWKYLVRDSRARERSYRRKGYDVRVIDSFSELKQTFININDTK